MKLHKIKEALSKVDEVTVMELLDLKSHELVEAFEYKISERKTYLIKELELGLDEKVEELNFE
jgi:hypothetical protein